MLRRAIFLFLLAGGLEPALADVQSSHQAGKAWAENGAKGAAQQIQHFTFQELISPNQQGQTFDPQKAKQLLKSGTTPHSEAVDFVRSEDVINNREVIDENECFLEQSEKIISQDGEITLLEPTEYTLKTCYLADAPRPISVIRTLNVEVNHDPGVIREVKTCIGHWREERFSKKESAKNHAERWRQEFREDPSVQDFHVKVTSNGALHKHSVKATWTHYDDAQTCSHYQSLEETIREPTWEEVGDRWIYEDESILTLSHSPYCTFVEKTCLDETSSKTIHGKEVHRQCWKEKLTFLCTSPNTESCSYYKDKNCELIKKECLEENSHGCSYWELTFKCYSKFNERQIENGDLFGLDQEPEYENNDSFSEVMTKLAVFDEMKKDLQNSDADNIRHIEVFKGQPMKCSKSIADEIMYDCCFTHSGLATKLKLAQCNEDEVALAEMREAGLCHYVGSYSEKFHELWKSRDEHVFCCYKTKLARVLQEQGREQINLGWGEPKTTPCKGLTIDQISSLDFSSMDFSELYEGYEAKLPDSFQNTLHSFQKRLERKVKEESV